MNDVMQDLVKWGIAGSKLTKAQAWMLVKELAEKHPDSVQELGALYRYFMPPVPKAPKTAYQWVAKAMGKKDVRHYLNYVHVSENWVQATDGHRAHRAPNTDGLPPGFYNAAGDLVERPEFARFPDVDRIIPKLMGMTFVVPDVGQWTVSEQSGEVIYVLPTGHRVSKAYMDQALAHPAGVHGVYVQDDVGSALRIEYKGTADTVAVIMPIRPPKG